MKRIVHLLWTEPIAFLSAVAAVFTVSGAVAAQIGAPDWVGIVTAVVGPAIASAARSKAWAPVSVNELAVRKQRAHQSAPEHGIGQ